MEQGAHDAKDRVDVRKDAYGIRAPFDFPVESFDRIGAADFDVPAFGQER